MTDNPTTRKANLLSYIDDGKGSRIFHLALRGIDTFTFTDFQGTNPIGDIVISCDYGDDHEAMKKLGPSMQSITLEESLGYHRDWSTDDLDRIPDLPAFQQLISSASIQRPILLVPFKNTPNVEGLRGNGVNVLSPPYSLVHFYDSKIKLLSILKESGIDQIPGEIVRREELTANKYLQLKQRYGSKLVAQTEFSGGGSGTFFVNSIKGIEDILNLEFKEVKISKFINGPTFNGQACTLRTTDGERTLVFNPSFQIIGLPDITDWPSYYCGNDFSGALAYLGETAMQQYISIMDRLGNHMASNGWKGMFGVDLIYDSSENKMYVLEINPRMQASTSFLHLLQEEKGMIGIGTWHLLAFLAKEPLPADLVKQEIVDLRGSHVLINNRTGEDVQLRGGLDAGVYTYNHRSNHRGLTLVQPHYWRHLQGREILITCGVPVPSGGTFVENHATMLKLYTPMEALNRETFNSLTPNMAAVVNEVYSKLGF